MRFGSLLRVLCLAKAAAAVACTQTDGETSDAGTFSAVQGDFQAFHSWPSFTFTGTSIAGSPHLAPGPRTDYLNKRPPPGATEFPVGTIIVKELAGDPPTARQIFAMVKVGGGYNAQGAAGWEWYELQNNADGSVAILWDGVVPPPGEKYASTAISCNACHAGAKNNDFVQSPPLQLPALERSDGAASGDAASLNGDL